MVLRQGWQFLLLSLKDQIENILGFVALQVLFSLLISAIIVWKQLWTMHKCRGIGMLNNTFFLKAGGQICPQGHSLQTPDSKVNILVSGYLYTLKNY